MYERGAVGEQATAQVLACLPPERWTVFHDLRWPGRRHANVDHVVVGPAGVFVIDSKNWSGSVAVRGGVLRQDGRSREMAVVGAAESAIAVAQLCPSIPINWVRPVLCFVRRNELTGWSRDVMVCSTGNILNMLESRPPMLSPAQVHQVSRELAARFRPAVGPAHRHASPSVPAFPARQLTAREVAGAFMGAVLDSRGHGSGTRRASSSTGGDLGKLVLLLLLAIMLLAAPQVLFGVVDNIAALIGNASGAK